MNLTSSIDVFDTLILSSFTPLKLSTSKTRSIRSSIVTRIVYASGSDLQKYYSDLYSPALDVAPWLQLRIYDSIKRHTYLNTLQLTNIRNISFHNYNYK